MFVRALVRALMARKSYALGKHNANLRNHVKFKGLKERMGEFGMYYLFILFILVRVCTNILVSWVTIMHPKRMFVYHIIVDEHNSG